MARELNHITGYTSGTGTSGAFVMESDMWYGVTNMWRLPKGMALKIWAEKIVGAPDVQVKLWRSSDTGSTFTLLRGVEYLSSAGQLMVNRESRPLLIQNHDGTAVIKVGYVQSGNSSAYVEFNCEVTPIE
jgi:hypothetical protein